MTENPSRVYKSGFVALIGKPNAGKSTLLNRLMGQPIAGVSAKPQTTRRRQLGILSGESFQMIFVDTPGLHEPKDKLSQFINSEAMSALRDAELILFLADASSRPDGFDQKLVELLGQAGAETPVVLLLNKADAVEAKSFDANRRSYQALLPESQSLPISAQTGMGVESLLKLIQDLLPEGPQYFPEEQITEDFERDIAAEMVRAACMDNLQDEVPYSIACLVDEYTERDQNLVYIKATIFVEREVQKGIVIGKKGEMIKRIGSTARQEIEKMSGQSVYLDLSVKVRKDWKNDQLFLRGLGLAAGE